MKLSPNQICPCGSQIKFKKCCAPYLKGQTVDHPERLVRSSYVAMITGDSHFLWQSLHPMSPRKLHDSERKFKADRELMREMRYEELIIIDGDVSHEHEAVIVFFVRAFDGAQDVSYLEEAQYKKIEEAWYYFDGLKRGAASVMIDPISLKVGQLETLFKWDAGLN